MRKSDEWTAIPVRKVTRAKLKKMGKKGESYDDLISGLIKKGGGNDG